MTADSDLSGKVALVTGASGGIGSAIAETLAAHGCALALHYRSDAASARRLSEKLSALGTKVKLLKADLLKPGAAAALVRQCVTAFGRLDILINNAGAVIRPEDFMRLDEKAWDETMRLNATVPFLLSREAFKAMKDGGRIVNISSVAAKFGGSSRSMHYGAAKAALESLTAGLARQGAPRGILVNAIRAGVIDTAFHDKFRKDMKKRVALVPLRRMGRPQDVARAALYLAGPGGDFVTGQVLGVTGGE